MLTPSTVRTATALAFTALLVACAETSTTGLAEVEEPEATPVEEVTPAVGAAPPVAMANAESLVTIGSDVADDDSETIEGGGDDPFSPESRPFVTLNAPSSAEAGTSIVFGANVLNFAPGAPTYKVFVIPDYVPGRDSYTGWIWEGTVTGGVVNLTAPLGAAVLGTTRIIISVTNVNGRTTEKKNVQVLPRRPRFTGADLLPATRVAGIASTATLTMQKPAQPTAPNYVLPLTVDFGDGRTESFDWDIIEAASGAYVNIPMTWWKPGTYDVTFRVAATSAPAYSSTHTESITILPNPAWPHITDFVSPAQVIPGRTYQLTFDPGGPEHTGEFFEVRTYRGGSYSTTFVRPGEPAAIVFSGPAELGESQHMTIVSGTVDGVLRADTVHWSTMVVPEPIVIQSFTGPVDASFGEEATFSFRATGGPGPYTATIDYGDGSEPTEIPIARNATVTRTHTWAASGVWNMTIVVANAVTSVTRTEEITIYRPRPTVDDLSIPDVLHFGEESVISFVPNDGTPVELMGYWILISNEDGPAGTMSAQLQQGTPVVIPIEGPPTPMVIQIKVVVGSRLNGLVLLSDTSYHTLTIRDLVCPAGSYREDYTCVDAPAGYHVPAEGAFEAVPCPAGTYQDQPGQTSCLPAPAGSAVPVPGSTQPQLCPAGSWQDQSGSTSCKPAMPGHFVGDVGATQATPCAAGTFQPASGSTSCIAAAPGSYVSTSGATQATQCAPGTFQPAAGSMSCLDAAPGSFVAGSGAAQATLCPAGTYQPASGQTGCLVAPVGSYVDFAGAAAATPCPETTSTMGTGSASASDCVPLGDIMLSEIEAAVTAGLLVPAAGGNGGQQQFNSWIAGLERSFEFLEGAQRQAGCSGARNALLRADGLPSPNDVVTGPARPDVEAALRRIIDEYGC